MTDTKHDIHGDPPSYADATRSAPPPQPIAQPSIPPPVADSQAQPEPTPFEETAEAEGYSPFEVPKDVQRVYPPLAVRQAHQKICDRFHVIKNPSGEGEPSLSLHTEHSKVLTSLWIDGTWDKPFDINIKTSHSKADVAVHLVNPKQPINLTVKTSHSPIQVALPPSFHGLLTLTTVHSRVIISPDLQAMTTRIASEDSTWRNAETYLVGPAGGPSRAFIQTVHSSITVGLTTDPAAESSERGSKCVLM